MVAAALAAESAALAAASVSVVAAFCFLPGDYVLSDEAWLFLAVCVVLSAWAAGLLAAHVRPTALTAASLVLALIAVPILAAVLGGSWAELLPFAILLGCAVAARRLRRLRVALPFVAALMAAGLLALMAVGWASGLLFRSEDETLPVVASPDGRLVAVVTVVRTGAWGSNWADLRIAPTGLHIFELHRFIDDNNVGLSPAWSGPREVRVGSLVVKVGL